MSKVKTNREWAKLPAFVKACEELGIEPTPRQASKYRNKKGMLYNRRKK